jgi:actin-related protein
LAVPPKFSDHVVLLLISPQWGHNEVELATKFFFEETSVAGLAVFPSAIPSLLGTNSVTGLVIDIGYETISTSFTFTASFTVTSILS